MVVEIYHSTISEVSSTSGEQGFGGDDSAMVVMTTNGADASTPHLTWDDQPITNNSVTFFKFLDSISVTTVRSKVPFILESRHKNILMWKKRY